MDPLSQNNQVLSGTQQDMPSESPSVDPNTLKEINRTAGAASLKQLFDSGLLKHDEPPAHEKVAVILSGKPNKKRNSPLTKVASARLENNLGKFLEVLGKTPNTTDEKSLEKLKLKAKQIVSLMPGMKGIGADGTEQVTNAILKAATRGELSDLQDIIDHEASHSKSNKTILKKIAGLFEGEYQHEDSVDPKEHQDIHDYVESNGLKDDINLHHEYAEGGEVSNPQLRDRVGEIYPEQSALMNAHKARSYAYLNSVKPNRMKALPFDSSHKDHIGDENYKQALNLAARPLSILDQVKNQNLSPKSLKHFVSLHPELYDVLKHRMSENIAKQHIEGKRPSYKERQSMSIFMGAPLESSFTPQNIMAAQATFKPIQKPQPGQDQSKTKKGTSTLGKSNKQYRTPEQAAEVDKTSRD